MIYQVRANLYFTDLSPIDDIKDKILDNWDEARILNPDQDNAEFSIIEVIENHHDEDPNAPCTVLFRQTTDTD